MPVLLQFHSCPFVCFLHSRALSRFPFDWHASQWALSSSNDQSMPVICLSVVRMLALWCVAASLRCRPHATTYLRDTECRCVLRMCVTHLPLELSSTSLTRSHSYQIIPAISKRRILRNESRRIVYAMACTCSPNAQRCLASPKRNAMCVCVCACASYFDFICICKWVNVEVRYAIIMRRL